MAEKGLKPLPEAFPAPADVRSVVERLVRKRRTRYERFCDAGGRIFGWLVKGSKISDRSKKELRDAGLDITPEQWLGGSVLALTVPIVLLVGFWVALWFTGSDPMGVFYLPLAGIMLGGFAFLAVQVYPASVAASRMADAQGKAVLTIMLMSFSLYHRPDLRSAVIQAADSTEGKLAEDLQRGLLDLDQRKRYETVRHLLTVIANEWGEIDESTRQAIFDLLRSTGTRDESARIADISRAPSRVLEGAEEQLTRKLGGLIMPTLAFLTFSSLAIIGVIGLSPVFGLIGGSAMDIKFFILMCALLVLAFWAFTSYMSKGRPATIQVPEPSQDDPRLPPPGKCFMFSKKVPVIIPTVLVFIALSIPGLLHLMGWSDGIVGMVAGSLNTMWFVWALAGALAVYGYLYSSTRRKVRDEERKIMVDWSNALNTMGSRMLDGKPVSGAMSDAGALMEGSPLSLKLKSASAKMERYGMGLREAIFGRGKVKGNRLVESFISTISRIRSDSELAAGRACMTAAEFLRTLHRVERNFRERIGEALGNLWLVAVVLIPVVCAMSVWVMDFMTGLSFKVAAQAAAAGITGIPFFFGVMAQGDLAVLRFLLGATSVLLGVIVAMYIARISAGPDRVEMWSSVLKSSIASATIFTVTSFLLAVITVGVG